MLGLEKASKKAKVSLDIAKEMIVVDHELRSFKNKLVNVDVDLSKECQQIVNRISKNLQIEPEAVLCYILARHVEKMKEESPPVMKD